MPYPQVIEVKAVSVEDVEIVALLHFSISERQCRNSVGCLNDGAKDGGKPTDYISAGKSV